MKLFDENLEQIVNIATDYIYDGNYTQAFNLIESGLMQEPGYAKLHNTLAWMYHYYNVNNQHAERHYLLALHFEPDNEYALEGITELYFSHQKYTGMIRVLKSVLDAEGINKNYVFEHLGKAYELTGDYKTAIQNYRNAISICVDNEDLAELKKNIKRTKFKRFKKAFNYGNS